jgi:hypothetical protein
MAQPLDTVTRIEVEIEGTNVPYDLAKGGCTFAQLRYAIASDYFRDPQDIELVDEEGRVWPLHVRFYRSFLSCHLVAVLLA